MNSFAVKKNVIFKKIIAMLVIVSFFFTNAGGGYFSKTVHAQEVTGLPVSGGVSGYPGGFSPSHLADISSFSVPFNLGTIKDVFKGDVKHQAVIHIQDAHADYGCQKAIAGILTDLAHEYKVSTVYLEGGTGEYSLRPFLEITDSAVRERVSDYFLRQGEMNGAEYFAVNDPGAPGLWGVEDVKLYRGNLKVYRDYLRVKDEITGLMNELEEVLDEFKAKVYSPGLNEFDRVYTRYKRSEIEYKQYIEYLLREFRKNCAIRDSSFPMELKKKFSEIHKLTRVFDKEEKIDFEKAGGQRDALVGLILKKFPARRLEKFAGRLNELKEGRVPEWSFYEYLGRKAECLDMDVEKDMPELYKYSEYIKTYAEIDEFRLLEQVTSLEDLLKDGLAQDPVQKELVFLTKHLDLTERLFNFAFSRKDYDYYLAHPGNFSAGNYINFINKFASVYGVRGLPRDVKGRLVEAQTGEKQSQKKLERLLRALKRPRNDGAGRFLSLITGLLSRNRLGMVSLRLFTVALAKAGENRINYTPRGRFSLWYGKFRELCETGRIHIVIPRTLHHTWCRVRGIQAFSGSPGQQTVSKRLFSVISENSGNPENQ